MKRILVIVGLAIASLIAPWQLGYDPSSLAAPSDYSIGWTAVKPSPVLPGTVAQIETRVQGRVAGAITVEAVARSAQGQVAWQQTWADQTFSRWQNRNYTATWTVPSEQPAGAYTLEVRLLRAAATPAVLALRTADFQIGAATPVIAPTATPGTPPTATPTSTPGTPPMATPTRTPTATPPASGTLPFTITGAASFQQNIRDALAYINRVSASDYAMIAGGGTSVRQVIQSGDGYPDRGSGYASGSTIWVRNIAGPLLAGLLVGEAAHINLYGYGCRGETKTLEQTARFLERAATVATSSRERELLLYWASYYRSLMGSYGC